MERIAAFVAGLLLAFVGTSTAFGQTTYHVPSDFPDIQNAMNSNLVVDGDTIQVAAGPYNEHSLNPNGKAITIQGTLNSNGSLATTVDAQQGGSVFVIQSGDGSGIVIKDLVLTGGTGTDVSGNTSGGGIMCSGGTLTITNCTISGNSAYLGAGIYCFQTSPTITDCRILLNEAYSGGGIKLSSSNANITGCSIDGNTASGYDGGGIYCIVSNPTFTNCTITNNTTPYDGGGFLCTTNSNPTITGCTISGNTANGDGGGISCDTGSSPTITNSTISGNTANYGGGIYCKGAEDAGDSSPIITGGTISNNTANTSGGGIYAADDSSPTITTCTLTNNSPNNILGDFTMGRSTGSCCYDGLCFSISEDHCNSVGGTFANEPCSSDTACAAACDHDSDNDGDVDINDLLTLLSTYGICQ